MNATLPPAGHRSDPPPNETRLESWGEIASYLRRDIRTVQRWERTLGLPVRRLQVGKISSVYAYRSELDKWYLERQPPDEPTDKAKNPDAPNFKTDEAPQEDAQQDSDTGNGSVKFWPRVAMMTAVFLAVAGGVRYYPVVIGHFWPTNPVAGKMRLFVRPFANHSGDPQQGQFINGLTDEIIAQLGRVDPSHLGVIAATSSELLASKSIDELGGLLHVQYILEGSVRRSGTQLRINTELIQVSDQTHIWADSYTGDLTDIAGVQDKVALAVAKQIHVALPSPVSTPVKIDPAAYDMYLKGRSYWASRDLAKSIDAYEQAIQADPNYAPAYAGLASAYLLFGNVPNDGMPPLLATPKAREAAQHAIRLNPSIAEAHCVLANIAMSYDWDFTTAEREYQRAISLDPNYATAHEWFAHYLIVRNRVPEAQKEMSYALDLDPFSPLFNAARAETFYYARDYDAVISNTLGILEQHNFALARFWLASAYREKKMYPQAIAEFDKMRKQSGNGPAMLMAYGHALAVSGDATGARKVLSELEELSRSRYVPALYFAAVHTGLGEKNQALAWLEKAYSEHNDRLIYLGIDPLADPLRAEPRFRELLSRVGVP
jgi:TolB-like protein/cytochrome c-type biogenesis protein CcmH/NrfG